MSQELVDFATETTRVKRGGFSDLLDKPNYTVAVGSILFALVLCMRGYVINIQDRQAGAALIGSGEWLLMVVSFHPFMLGVAAAGLALSWRRRNTPVFTFSIGAFCFLVTLHVAINAFHAIETTRWNSDWIRLQLHKTDYNSDIAQVSEPDGVAFRVWPWGHNGPDDTSGSFYYLVYDSTDQIMAPAESRSTDWRRRAGGWKDMQAAEEDDSSTTIKTLDPHFYLVTLTQ